MSNLSSFVIEVDLLQRTWKYLDIETFEMDLVNLNKIYWVHCDLSLENELDKFKKKLQLTKEVKGLCHGSERISKTIETENYLTLQVQCLLFSGKRSERNANLLIHLTPRYCFTASTRPLPMIKKLIANFQNYVHYAHTPCFILFIMLDSIVSLYLDRLYQFEIEAEEMDLQLGERTYKEVADLKNHVMHIKRYSVAILNVLMHTSARKIQVVSEHCRGSLIDLLNNAQLVVTEADSIRELLNGTLGRIDNTLMHQVNNAMKILTAVATIFMPPTLIAGIYGMNLLMPEYHWKYGYPLALILMTISGTSMFFYFRKKKWI